jgi:hypothetical protein
MEAGDLLVQHNSSQKKRKKIKSRTPQHKSLTPPISIGPPLHDCSVCDARSIVQLKAKKNI